MMACYHISTLPLMPRRKGIAMKLFLVFLFLLITTVAAHATVAPSLSEPDDTQEGITMLVGTMSTVVNAAMIANKSPSYWLGALGIAAGATALVMRGQTDVVHENGLLGVGLVSVTAGAITLRYRNVLGHAQKQARLEPSWYKGSTGFALVIDF